MVYATRSRTLAQRRGAAGGTASAACTLGEDTGMSHRRRSRTYLSPAATTRKMTGVTMASVAAPTPSAQAKKPTVTAVVRHTARKPTANVGASKMTKAAMVEANIGREQETKAHHLRFKNYTDSEDASSDKSGDGDATKESIEQTVDTIAPRIQSNRESRHESLNPHGSFGTERQPSSVGIRLSSNSGLDGSTTVHRTHLHFRDSDDSQGTGGYSHDPTDREYMSGELSKEDDCVPSTLKRTRTMLETFAEGREFLGRDWHFKGEDEACEHKSRVHNHRNRVLEQKHKHKHKRHHRLNDAHNQHHREAGDRTAENTCSVTHAQSPVEDDSRHLQHPIMTAPSESSLLSQSTWGLQSAFDRLSSFFSLGARLGDQAEASDAANGPHIVECCHALNQHIRWPENASDVESSEPISKRATTSPSKLRSALKNSYKKRAPNRHVTYQDDAEGAGKDEVSGAVERGTELSASDQGGADKHSRWSFSRLGSAFFHFRNGQLTSSSVSLTEPGPDDHSASETKAMQSSSPAFLRPAKWAIHDDKSGKQRSEMHSHSNRERFETRETSSTTLPAHDSNIRKPNPPSPSRRGNEATVHLLTQRSQLDCDKALHALQHLDQDICLLQQLLQEKELALRAAEAALSKDQHRSAIHTETLTREIDNLELSIRELRLQVLQREQELTAVRLQLANENKQNQKQLSLLGRKITTLNQTNLATLKDKKATEKEAMRAKSQLDEVNHERDRLLMEMRELNEQYGAKESKLAAAQASLQSFERSATNERHQAENLAKDLKRTRSDLRELRHQLLQALDQVKGLNSAEARAERARQQLEAAKDEIKSREGYIRALEKTNASMSHKSDEAAKFADEVLRLKEQLAKYKGEMDEARNLIDELTGSRNRAAILSDRIATLEQQATRQKTELEQARERLAGLEDANDRAEELAARVIDLQDQVIVEEKHLTYLENKMLEHENCAANAKQLADRIVELEEQIDKNEKEIHRLQKAEQHAEKQDEQVASLQAELQQRREELQDKSRALKALQTKYGSDTSKLESTASQLKTDIEALKQQLTRKTEELLTATNIKDQLALVQQEKEELSNVADRLYRELDHKETQLVKLKNSLTRSHQAGEQRQRDLDQATTKVHELREQARRFESEASRAKNEHAKVADDLAKVASSANQLTIKVDSLNDQISHKEAALAKAEEQAVQRDQKQQQQIQELQDHIQDLQREAVDNLTRARIAENEANQLEERASRVYGLETEIRQLNQQLGELQKALALKGAELLALNKMITQQGIAERQVDELKAQIRELKNLLETAQSQAKEDMKVKEDENQILKDEIRAWIDHEAEWIQRTMDLTGEIEQASQATRNKDRQLAETKQQLLDQEAEVGRLTLERKRRGSETENRLRHKIRKLEKEKHDLTSRAGHLEDEKHRLTNSIELQHDQEAQNLELQERLREMLLWKENSIVQTGEWVTTVSNLEKGKTQLAKELAVQEKLVKQLQGEADGSTEWHRRTLGKAARLTGIVSTFEKELKQLETTLAGHDAKDASLHTILGQHRSHIVELESVQTSLHERLRERDATIRDLDVQLQQMVRNYKRRLADAQRESKASDMEVARLQALLTKNERSLLGWRERASKDRDLAVSLQRSLDKQTFAFQEQMKQFDDLQAKHEAALKGQATRDRQIYCLEKQLAETTDIGSEKMMEQHAQIRKLENLLVRSRAQTENLEIELHKAATNYHDTLILLEEANTKMKNMVPAANANHDTCVSRLQDSEREAERLAREVENLEDRIIVLGREAQVKARSWAKAEAEYKDRIEQLVQSRQEIEACALETRENSERERFQRDQDCMRLTAENVKNGELIQQLRRNSVQWEREYSEIETRMRRELDSTKELATKLVALRRSIMRDNQAELRALDDVEKELKIQVSKVEDTITFSRKRLDSGAFLDTSTFVQAHQRLHPNQTPSTC